MRTAEDIVKDYRARGYSDERLRALANGRPDPIRSQILELLRSTAPGDEEPAESLIEDVLARVDAEEATPVVLPECEEEMPPAKAARVQTVSETADGEEADEARETLEAVAEQIPTGVVDIDKAGIELLSREAEAQTPAPAREQESPPATATAVSQPANTAAGKPRLAEIVVERMTREEYLLHNPEAAPQEERLESIEPDAAQAREMPDSGAAPPKSANTASPQPERGGEPVPLQDESEQPLERVQSELLAVLEPDSREAMETLKQNRAAVRSLQVLQEALQENPELLSESRQESKVIALDPPYALPDQEMDHEALNELAVEVDTRQQAASGKNKSGLIKFPTEMVAAYEAIAVSQQGPALDADAAAAGGNNRQSLQGAVAGTMEEAIGEEIAILRNWLSELEDALKLKKIENEELARMLAQRDETLRVQAEELARVRQEMHADEARVSEVYDAARKLQDARAELAAVRKEMTALEREYNILATETVPSLKQDKDDLAEMLEEEAGKQRPLQEALRASGRRLAVSYTLAAAASLLMVLSLVFQWVTGDSERVQRDQVLASLRDNLAREKERTASLDQQARLLEAKWSRRYQDLRQQKARLVMDLARKDQIIARKERQLELATLQGGAPGGGGAQARTRDDVIADNRILASAAGARSRATYGDQASHRNQVQGIAQWRARHARKSGTAIKTKIGRVRRGEGISHVLWREIGISNPALVGWVAKRNGLKKSSSQGYWVVHPGDELILPASPDSVADAGRADGRSGND